MGICNKSLKYESIGTHLISLYLNDNNVTYFDSFGVEHIPIEIKKFLGNKNITKSIYKNTSIRFQKVWILLHWIYWFHVKKETFAWLYKYIFSYWLWNEWQNNTDIFSITKKT